MADITPSTDQGRAEWNSQLAEVARTTTDFSSFEVDEIQPREVETQETDTDSESSALPKEDQNQPADSQDDRSKSNEDASKEPNQSQDELNKIPDANNNQEEAVSKRPDQVKGKSQAVPYERFSQVTSEKNEWKAKYEALAKEKGGQPQSEAKPDYAIPPPYDKKPEAYKSNFSEEQLNTVLTSNADEETKQLARVELNKIHDSERRLTRWEAWEARNQQAYQKKQADEAYYTQEAIKTLPELNVADSPAIKEFQRLMGIVNEVDQGFMKHPKARLMLAQVARDRLASARMDTVLQENKKLKDEIQGLRKARQPLVASGKQEVGEATESNRPPTTNSLAEKIRLSGVNRG